MIALLGYLPGTLFAAYDQVLIFAFYARRRTRIAPVLVGVLAARASTSRSRWRWSNSLGMLGLVLANSAQFVAHAMIMVVLARRVFGIAGWQRVRYAIERCAVAGLLMAGATVTVWAVLDWMVPAGSSAISILVCGAGAPGPPDAGRRGALPRALAPVWGARDRGSAPRDRRQVAGPDRVLVVGAGLRACPGPMAACLDAETEIRSRTPP